LGKASNKLTKFSGKFKALILSNHKSNNNNRKRLRKEAIKMISSEHKATEHLKLITSKETTQLKDQLTALNLIVVSDWLILLISMMHPKLHFIHNIVTRKSMKNILIKELSKNNFLNPPIATMNHKRRHIDSLLSLMN